MAQGEAGSANDARAPATPATLSPPTDGPARSAPERVGPYRILSTLGEGGFGIVLLAEQTEPVRRRVALKLIKPGMDTAEVVARFEAERQALAVMDHPGVAKVYDGGVTPEGRPYFAMEYVHGLPITQHCDRRRLGLRQRIELFIQVCQAVQHAHMKGVIHRDLKPSNILVEYADGHSSGSGALPKVIDFGIAKALNQRLTERTLFTELGQMIGTPEYMSPEQAEMGGQDIDTRADVYSLGVVLYELLAGAAPFDAGTLRRVGFAELQRIIREVDPPRPSQRLGSSRRRLDAEARDSGPGSGAHPQHFDLDAIARCRGCDARGLLRALRGDLDWVVMKCLEKDRSRRYETANALAMDLTRYLRHEPVLAGSPSTAYRVRKFIQRRRGPVAAAVALLVALLSGISGIALSLREARHQHRLAQQAEAAAQLRADQLEQVAEFQAAQLADIDTAGMGARLREALLVQRREALRARGEDAVAAGVAQLDAALDGVNFTGLALDTLDSTIFERALDAIDTRFVDQPPLRASLLQTLAITLRELGLLERARQPQAEALEIRLRELGQTHPDSLTSMHHAAYLAQQRGRIEEAERGYRETLDQRRRVLGESERDTLQTLANLGLLLQGAGRLDEAEPLLREALELRRHTLGDAHPDTLVSINNMGFQLYKQGRLDEAEALLLEALEGYRGEDAPEHPVRIATIANFGLLRRDQGRLDEAEPYYRQALEMARRALGDRHPDTLRSINNMGALLRERGDLAAAADYYRESLQVARAVMGANHPNTIIGINNLGGLLRDLGELEEAERLGREAVERARLVLPPGHPNTGVFIGHHARTLARMGRFAEAERATLEAHAIHESALGPGNARTLTIARQLVQLYEDWEVKQPGRGRDPAQAWRLRIERSSAPRAAAEVRAD